MSFTWFRPEGPLRTREQVAREVHAVSLSRGLDDLATVIALMTISTEVGTGTGDNRQWWCPANDRVPATKNYPHDSKSDDNRSSGYFQQQPGPNGEPWWGTPENMMTLSQAANTFLTRLADDYGRAKDNPRLAGEFAQRVQQSAFPDRYAEKWDEAWSVLRRALGSQPPTPPKETPVTWTGDPVWLEEVLRPALGDRLKTLPGWQNSGHGDFKDIRGVMVHHTGNSRESAQSIRNGRPDLAGPLANIHIAPDGTVTIVAVGVCWHAGQGSYPWLPTNNANAHMIGIECAWPTPRPDLPKGYDPAERWPDAQIISMRDTCAALALKLELPATRVIGHKEWAGAAQGKWDPGNLDMSWFRGEVRKDMEGFVFPGEHPPIEPQPGPTLPPDYAKETWDQLRIQWPQLGGRTLVDAVAVIGEKLGIEGFYDVKKTQS
ncbi:lysin A [Mycobacterium phage Jabbawokkie]|uniref:N-acetylmuramoyl-L-alanine amidase n=2 Tax=Avanivirus TaxID=2843352 RepID=A0A2D1GA73_9CAUD|nr:endolysin [Mycobacterium phage Jabbawokkie]YP_009963733.1 endolysin [Mycobacterium phage Demsculpinboyz]YP_009963954.1 endolysin [Mycobacterium phage Zapner]AGT12137.1 lysin A [Mycobacterium phage Jabbawokkie]AHZ95491.1 lysin A [Mycobacterium phage Zapner]ATN88630.1 lysin A [Mycobacterium phage Demsculpinboyz]